MKHAIAIGGGFSKLDVLPFQKDLPLSLFDMLLAKRRGEGSRTWCSSICGSPSLMVSIVFLDFGPSFLFFEFLPLFFFFFFLGALIYLWLARFHHFFNKRNKERSQFSMYKAYVCPSQHKLRPILTYLLHIDQRVGKHGK